MRKKKHFSFFNFRRSAEKKVADRARYEEDRAAALERLDVSLAILKDSMLDENCSITPEQYRERCDRLISLFDEGRWELI